MGDEEPEATEMAGLLSKTMVGRKTLDEGKGEPVPEIWDTDVVIQLCKKLGQLYPGETVGKTS